MSSATGQDAYRANMRFVAKAVAYNRYLVDQVRPYLGDRVLDVGCGIGNTTALLDRPYVVGMDVTDSYLDAFRENLPDVPALKQDIASPTDLDTLRAHRFDTVFSSNVIEHIEDDAAALRNMHAILEERGRVVLLVPQYPFLYGSMDAEDLHFRRYTRAGLESLVREAGFTVERSFSVNLPGILWWYVSGKILRRGTSDESEAGLINAVVPIVRVIDRLVRHSAGLSLVVVARRDGT